MKPNAESFNRAKENVLAIYKKDQYMQWLGLEFLDFSQDFLAVKMPVRDELLNSFGAIHGGVLYSLADITAGSLSCAQGKISPTVDGHLNYLEPAVVKEYVVCEAKLQRCGSHLVSLNVEIKNEEGKLLDTGCFTFYRTNSSLVE